MASSGNGRLIYWATGFSKTYNFVLWLVLGGFLFAFSLIRLLYLDRSFCNKDSSGETPLGAGECFYFSQPLYNIAMTTHLAGILPAAILSLLQFLPVVRRKSIAFHRVNGYLVNMLSVIGTLGGFIIIPVTYGGGLDVQTSTGLMGMFFIGAVAMAMTSIKRHRLDQHRAWMLRAWVMVSAIVTTRVMIVIMALKISTIDTYYSAQPCDKIAWLFENNPDMTLSAYPECEAYFTGLNPHQHVSIKANLGGTSAEKAAALDMTFGPCMWLGLAIHASVIECYLRFTHAESERLLQISYQRQLKAGLATEKNVPYKDSKQ